MPATDLDKTEALKAGDPCEFRTNISPEWKPGRVIRNGGAYYWRILDEETGQTHFWYIENVRAPGTDPWFS